MIEDNCLNLCAPRRRRQPPFVFAAAAVAVLLACSLPAARAVDPQPASAAPVVAGAAELALPAGFQGAVVATGELLANPVGICLDEGQNLYVAETFRQLKGVEDDRNHSEWLLDDLAAQTVDDRRAYMTKHYPNDLARFTTASERVRRLTDKDGDRVFDESTVFADGFKDLVDGTGADVRARGGEVLFTCIPNLWRLQDNDSDGRADDREKLFEGFGVRTAFRGHDLHGMIWGPDGRLYFSIGDRGFNVTNKEGKLLKFPDRGAVLRCEADGSNLEVYASGLRNPQDLAFDELGNLFTCDNNSDAADQARIVNVVPGIDAGWRMYYQYLPDRGPWCREGLWQPRHPNQAAYIMPPLANFADGPSGLAVNPGVGLAAEYAGWFFLCDFRGAAADSGVRAFKLRPTGASFELADAKEFLWRILATDLEFGSDGSLYVADWIAGWDGTGEGRVVRIWDPAHLAKEPIACDPKAFREMTTERLADLLSHPDQRVRLEAQYALAERGEAAALAKIAADPAGDRLARIQAIWGLGQIGRRDKGKTVAAATLAALLTDADAEIRAQAIKTLGDLPSSPALEAKFIALLRDESPRVQTFAALDLARHANPAAIEPLFELLKANGGRDLVVRHAAVMGLAAQGAEALTSHATADQPTEVRLGMLLALRQLKSPLIARYLQDADPLLVLEAARAIHDEKLEGVQAELAAIAPATVASFPEELRDPLARRIVNANFRLAKVEPVLAWARSEETSQDLRRFALALLLDWAEPSKLDKVTGEYRPLPDDRHVEELTAALRSAIPTWLGHDRQPDDLVLELASKYGIAEATTLIAKLPARGDLPANVRVAALDALATLKAAGLAAALQEALDDGSPQMRIAALKWTAAASPSSESTISHLAAALDRGQWQEQQEAVQLLAAAQCGAGDQVLRTWLAKLSRNEAPPEIELELHEAAASRKLADTSLTTSGDDPLAPYRQCLTGGDGERGRGVFSFRADLACSRCHTLKPGLTSVCPNLSTIGAAKTREYLLESIVAPNKTIAAGYEMTNILTDAGLVVAGIVKSETKDAIELVKPDGTTATIDKATVEGRSTGLSAMPEGLGKAMTKRELRDLVEFLSQQKGAVTPTVSTGH